MNQMNFKQTLNQILIKNQDIYKIHNIDDLYDEFLKYGYEFSSDKFYKDFIEFFSFVFKAKPHKGGRKTEREMVR